MSLFNEVLEGGLNRALASRLGMQTSAPSPTIAPEIIPTIELPVAGAELLYAAGWRRWQRAVTHTGAAGQMPRMRVRLPQGSTTLVIVEEIVVSTPQVGVCRGESAFTGTVNLGTLHNVNYAFRDGHQEPMTGAALQLSSDSVAGGAGGNLFDERIAANVPVRVPGGPWLFLAGNAFSIGVQVDAAELHATVVWRERRLLPGEERS